jgi:hypothetical protein
MGNPPASRSEKKEDESMKFGGQEWVLMGCMGLALALTIFALIYPSILAAREDWAIE